MSIITSGNPVHPHMMVPNEGACTVMSEQNTDNLQDMSAHAQVLDKQNPKRVGGNISDSVLNSSETLLFTEVTAKVPLSLMNKLDIADQLPFLVKLAKDVNVSIVVGVEEEIETELKTYSFFGTLDSILEIQNRVKQVFHLPNNANLSEEREKSGRQIITDSVTRVSVGINTNSVSSDTVKDIGVMCRLLEEPKCTRSGRKVRIPPLHNLYDCDDENSAVENSDSEVKDGDEEWNNSIAEINDFHNGIQDTEKVKGQGEKGVSYMRRKGQRKRGRPKKTKVCDHASSFQLVKKTNDQTNLPQETDHSERLVEETPVCSQEVKKEIKEEKDGETDGNNAPLKSSTIQRSGSVPVNLEELIKTEKNPVQRTRLQKLLYEERTPNKFNCKHCSFSTKRQSHLLKHEEVHEKKHCKVYTCTRCDFKTIRKSKLLLHQGQCNHDVVQSEAGKDVSFVCTQCDYKCDSHAEMESHWRESHRKSVLPSIINPADTKKLKCHLCDYITDKPKMLSRHLSVHKESDNKLTELFKCPHEGCDYSTRSKGNYQFHVKGKHSNLKPYLCDSCGTKFKRKHSLKMHLKFVHVANNKKPLPFQCTTCSKRFRSKAHLQEHQVKHTNIRQHLCSICGVAFKTKSAAKRHLLTVHSSSVIRPVCEHCLKPFNSKYTLQRHLRAAEGKCGQADRLRNANLVEEGGKYELSEATVTMDLLKHPFDVNGTNRHNIVLQKDQVINVVPMEEGYTGEQILTVEIPAVGQNNVLGEEDVKLLQGSENLVILPTDGMVIQQQQDASGSVTQLSGQQALLGNETLQGLLSGQLFNVNSGEAQTQLMYISTT